LAFFGKLFLVFIYFFVFFNSFRFLKNQKINVFEYYILLLLSLLGILLIISSTDLLSFYLALELQSLCFYTLANFKKNSSFSTESGLKYFIIGAFSTGLFLLGCSFIYGFTGSTNFFFLRDLFGFTENVSFFSVYVGFFLISVGFLFKLGCAPFHFWVCDVYEGAPLVVTVFFSTAPKIALIVSFIRLVFFSFFSFSFIYQFFFIFCAFCCLVIGAFGGLAQKKVKRFLVFSSVGHMSFILLGFASNNLLGLQGLLFYTFFYISMSFFIWVSLFCFNRPFSTDSLSVKYLDEIEGLNFENPIFCFCLSLLFFSLAGIPPFVGFFIKFFIFLSVLDSSFFFILFCTFFFSVLSSFFYLRVVKIFYFSSSYTNTGFKSNFYFTVIGYINAFCISFLTFVIFFFFFSPSFFSTIFFRISLGILALLFMLLDRSALW